MGSLAGSAERQQSRSPGDTPAPSSIRARRQASARGDGGHQVRSADLRAARSVVVRGASMAGLTSSAAVGWSATVPVPARGSATATPCATPGRCGTPWVRDASASRDAGSEGPCVNRCLAGLAHRPPRFHDASMPNVLVRDLPDDVHAKLRRRATARGRSRRSATGGRGPGRGAGRTVIVIDASVLANAIGDDETDGVATRLAINRAGVVSAPDWSTSRQGARSGTPAIGSGAGHSEVRPGSRSADAG
jgi:hypothetical protein